MPALFRSRIGLALLAALLLGGATSVAQSLDPYANETKEQRDARMAWWRQAKFGMFIHWGVYAVPAGTYKGKPIHGIGEWIMRNASIPVSEYREFAKDFNPVKYDPNAWATLAQEAGMKYIIITSKHHDGFTLFPTAASKWNVVDATPYGKDLIGPLAEAARKRGLHFGLYYSQAQDWTNPGGAKAKEKEGGGWCEEHKGSFDEYIKNVAAPQVKEILTRYQPDVLWWDTPVWMNPERAEVLLPLLKLRPGLIVNNRLGGGYKGDTETPEQHIPAMGFKDRDWEACMTMNNTWGYKSDDANWKSTETIIRNLVDIVSKGGNYLLNIGPKADGTIPQESIDRLKEVGKWMKANGEAIYGTTASPTRRPHWGRITTKADGATTTLYLHVFNWPADGKLPVKVANKVVSCRLLADPARTLKVESGDAGLTVLLTGDAPDPICSVVALTIEGQPNVVDQTLRQTADGSLTLSAADADIDNVGYGKHAVLEQKDGQFNIGQWADARTKVTWSFEIAKAGLFEVVAEVAAPAQSNLMVLAGKSKVEATVQKTDKYQSQALGKVKLWNGSNKLTLAPPKKGWKPINVRSVTLKPAQ